MLLEGNFLLTKQDKEKDTFFQLHLIFQRNLSLKISHQKIEKCHTGGGGPKRAKKVSRII